MALLTGLLLQSLLRICVLSDSSADSQSKPIRKRSLTTISTASLLSAYTVKSIQYIGVTYFDIGAFISFC